MCDLYYGLWKTGRQEDEDLARKIKPRARYYMNILDRESGDVKILSIGVILFKKIIGAMLDEDFGDITDPVTGHDFKIVKEMEELLKAWREESGWQLDLESDLSKDVAEETKARLRALGYID